MLVSHYMVGAWWSWVTTRPWRVADGLWDPPAAPLSVVSVGYGLCSSETQQHGLSAYLHANISNGEHVATPVATI